MTPTFEWTISLGSVLMLIGTVSTIVGAYYSLARNVDGKFVALADRFTQQFNDVSIQLTKILDGDVRELRSRVVRLESGHSEWITTIRENTRMFATEQQALIMRVDRLERPGKPH